MIQNCGKGPRNNNFQIVFAPVGMRIPEHHPSQQMQESPLLLQMPEVTIPSENQHKTHDAQDRMALHKAPLAQNVSRLEFQIKNWDNLPEPIKVAIMAMVASVQRQLQQMCSSSNAVYKYQRRAFAKNNSAGVIKPCGGNPRLVGWDGKGKTRS